jgi:hypothetical protein
MVLIIQFIAYENNHFKLLYQPGNKKLQMAEHLEFFTEDQKIFSIAHITGHYNYKNKN